MKGLRRSLRTYRHARIEREHSCAAGLRKQYVLFQYERCLLYSGSSSETQLPQLPGSSLYHTKLHGVQSQVKIGENTVRGEGSITYTQMSRMSVTKDAIQPNPMASGDAGHTSISSYSVAAAGTPMLMGHHCRSRNGDGLEYMRASSALWGLSKLRAIASNSSWGPRQCTLVQQRSRARQERICKAASIPSRPRSSRP